jgi:DNA-binding HxlR family transcriptional regulator
MSEPDPIEPNSLGLSSLVLGDRWNLMILREAFRGAHRFQDWTNTLGVSDPVLATRLRDLTGLGLLDRTQSPTSPGRPEYHLTPAAKDMWSIFVAIWLWNLHWASGTDVSRRARLRHHDCGFAVRPLLGCGACRAHGVTPFETSVVRAADYSYDEGNPPRPYRRIKHGSATVPADLDAVGLLGDRWSTSVLAAAFLGAHRFSDFSRDIGSIPPLILTQRLNTFVEARVLVQQPVASGKRRLEYHLTSKGSDFFGIFSNQISWSSRVFADRSGPPLTIRHLPCGSTFDPVYFCNACDGQLERRTVAFEYHEVSPAGIRPAAATRGRAR